MLKQISFELENAAETEAVAVLVPAQLRRAGLLDGKFLDKKKFKDESGAIDLLVTNVLPKGAIDELSEYVSQLTSVKITGVILGSENLAQATQFFMQRTYVEFDPAQVANLETVTSLEAGKAAVRHDFVLPFVSAPMKSLEIKLLAKQKVSVTLLVETPDFSNTAAVQAAILPQQ
jgi:hypothetical protein